MNPFFSLAGTLQKARRMVSAAGSVSDEDVKSPAKLAEFLRSLQRRTSELEARLPPTGMEFEVNVGASGTLTTIYHRAGGPVRWYVVQWTQVGGTAYPESGPLLVQDATSTASALVLRSYVAGKAIVRLEPAFGDVDPGITVVPTPPVVVVTEYSLALSAQFNTASTTAVSTNLAFSALAGETWDLQFFGIASDSNVAGMKYAVGAPAGSTINGVHKTCTTGINVRVQGQINAINTLGAAIHTAAGVVMDDEIYVRVTVAGTPGTIAIQAASVAGTASIAAASSLIAKKVTLV